MTRRWFLSLAAALVPGTALAHHGWGGYDMSKTFTLDRQDPETGLRESAPAFQTKLLLIAYF
jgi:hypothetical protein